MKNIVILTGAGISAESGVATFRDSGGLWCNHRIEDVATPEGYAKNPALVQQFYNMRRAQLKEVEPNPAHIALAELGSRWEGNVTLITQNVDDLHERATKGKKMKLGYELIHMHGELRRVRCGQTGEIFDWHEDVSAESQCLCCNETGRLRPHIVWFGEMPLFMDEIGEAIAECDLFLSIGTSGNVYPAAGFVHELRARGRAHTVELNMEPSAGQSLFHEKIYGPASREVPAYVARILGNTDGRFSQSD
jgi:NAD-dependent deacetylase